MNKFLAKYGKASIFTLIVILCMSFLIHLFSVSSGYLQSIDRQALDRAENYAGEQAVQLQEQFGALKMRADYCASEVSEAGSLEGAVERLRSTGSGMRVADGDKFVAILYTKDGAVYTPGGDSVTGYSELTDLAEAKRSAVSRLFQYDNANMVFGVFAPCNSAYVDGVVLLYMRTAVSLEALVQESGQYISSVQASEFVLLCKHDGIILEKIRVGSAVDPGFGSVTEGLFKQIITDGDTMSRITTALSTGKQQSAVVEVGSVQYALSVRPLGSGCGGLILVGLYEMTELYGSGRQVLNTIWGTVAFLSLMLLGFLAFAIVDRIRTNRKIKTLTTVDAELDCLTRSGFEAEAQSIVNRLKGTQFAIVMLRVNNFRYISEQFGDRQNRAVLRFLRNCCAQAMLVSETFAYAGDGHYLLLLHYREKKALTSRLDGLYRQVVRYKFPQDDEYKLHISYSIYEVGREEDRSVGQMIDKLNIVDAKPTF